MQELIDTPRLIVYCPNKQTAVPDALLGSPIFYASLNEGANSQTLGLSHFKDLDGLCQGGTATGM